MGRLLNRAHEIRLVADYNGDSVEPADAKEIVDHAETFIAAMRTQFMSPGSHGNEDSMTPDAP